MSLLENDATSWWILPESEPCDVYGGGYLYPPDLPSFLASSLPSSNSSIIKIEIHLNIGILTTLATSIRRPSIPPYRDWNYHNRYGIDSNKPSYWKHGFKKRVSPPRWHRGGGAPSLSIFTFFQPSLSQRACSWISLNRSLFSGWPNPFIEPSIETCFSL